MRIFISGGGSGIGAALAERAAARGHAVFAGGRRFPALRRTPGLSSGEMWELPLDVTDEQSCRAAIGAMIAEAGGVDVLVANAGVAYAGAFEETPLAEFQRVMDVNYLGAVRLIKAVLPAMRRAGSGTIIAVTSLSALIGLPGDSAYAASKFALEGACESLANEVSRFAVRVVIVEPGAVKTELLAKSRAARHDPKSPYGAFNQSLDARRERIAGGAEAGDIAAEIAAIMENPEGALRRPVGDQARAVAAKLATLSGERRAAFARAAAGFDWWADGRPEPIER